MFNKIKRENQFLCFVFFHNLNKMPASSLGYDRPVSPGATSPDVYRRSVPGISELMRGSATTPPRQATAPMLPQRLQQIPSHGVAKSQMYSPNGENGNGAHMLYQQQHLQQQQQQQPAFDSLLENEYRLPAQQLTAQQQQELQQQQLQQQQQKQAWEDQQRLYQLQQQQLEQQRVQQQQQQERERQQQQQQPLQTNVSAAAVTASNELGALAIKTSRIQSAVDDLNMQMNQLSHRQDAMCAGVAKAAKDQSAMLTFILLGVVLIFILVVMIALYTTILPYINGRKRAQSEREVTEQWAKETAANDKRLAAASSKSARTAATADEESIEEGIGSAAYARDMAQQQLQQRQRGF